MMTTMLVVAIATAAINCGGGAAAAYDDDMYNTASRLYKFYSEHLVIQFSLLMSQMS
jgi:hypothetical protein